MGLFRVFAYLKVNTLIGCVNVLLEHIELYEYIYHKIFVCQANVKQVLNAASTMHTYQQEIINL